MAETQNTNLKVRDNCNETDLFYCEEYICEDCFIRTMDTVILC